MRKLKVLLPLTLIVTTVLSLFAISATATDGTTLSVDPLLTSCVDPGGMFVVDIRVTDVNDLYGFDFKLGYDTSVLTATFVSVAGNIFEPGYFIWKQEINDDMGRVWLAVTQELGAPTGVSGSGLLATITFTVDDRGASDLELYETELRDSLANLISHTVTDGGFKNAGIAVDPRIIWDPALGVGETFDVDIVINYVSDLYGFDFKLGYDTSVLTASAVTLTGNIFEPGYFIWKQEINDDMGRVWLAVTQELGAPAGVDVGLAGLAATITFTKDDHGASDLDLYETELRDSYANLIPICFELDGYFANTAPILWTKIKTKNPYPDWSLGHVAQTEILYAPVRNTGEHGAWVTAQFIIRNDATGDTVSKDSNETWIGPGATETLSTSPFTFDLAGTYHFSVVVWFRIHEYLTSEPYFLYQDQLGGAGISKEGVNRINVKA